MFSNVGAFSHNPNWEQFINREKSIYQRQDDIRTPFGRDYTRILHSKAYRRLKHKTQVFPATQNDHVCTRSEHINLVESVATTITRYLGLNTELTTAIATGHDISHPPFGHQGETILNNISKKHLGKSFWHEKNGLRFTDKVETLVDPQGFEQNLNLTYGVRDGIISHCGEVDENALFPRSQAIDLNEIERPNQYNPFTWEGCVVKIADKISYLGRDIEDAFRLKILSKQQLEDLLTIIRQAGLYEIEDINNTLLMHKFIVDLCKESSPERGICLSSKNLVLMNQIKKFNYENIYFHPRLKFFAQYADLVINSIFKTLLAVYDGRSTLKQLNKGYAQMLFTTFTDYLIQYSDIDLKERANRKCANDVVYFMDSYEDYITAIIDFISGMSDPFCLDIFKELTTF